MNIIRSINETELYNLEIFRGKDYFDELPGEHLLKDIYTQKADVVKLKVSLADTTLFAQLDRLNFPYIVQSLIFKNLTPVTPEDAELEIPANITYKRAEIDDGDTVEALVRNTLRKPTSSVYNSNYAYYHKDRYVDNTVAYLRSLIASDDKEVWILLDTDKPVGYFSGIFYPDYFEGILYGVLPEQRRKGFSNWIYAIMKSICAKKKVNAFINDVQIQNFGSVLSAGKIGMMSEMYYHLSIYPMMSERSLPVKKGNHKFNGIGDVADLLNSRYKNEWQKSKIYINLPVGNKTVTYTMSEHEFHNGYKILIIRIFDNESIKGHIIFEQHNIVA